LGVLLREQSHLQSPTDSVQKKHEAAPKLSGDKARKTLHMKTKETRNSQIECINHTMLHARIENKVKNKIQEQ
jgi:hypothetical protein